MSTALRERFSQLHRHGLFVMPNPFDVGSAKRLVDAGYPALATTSSGLAATLGKQDQQVTRDELLAHVAALASVGVPINVDAECCYPDDPGGIERTIDVLANAGAAGISIEDYVPGQGILPLEEAGRRVAVAAEATRRRGIVLTARAEHFLYDEAPNLAEVLTRLAAYRDVGADVLYAPGITTTDQIGAVVALGRPVNVLIRPGVPTTADLTTLGVRRVSTGGALTWAAYDAVVAAAPKQP